MHSPTQLDTAHGTVDCQVVNARTPIATLVFAHGAGANIEHRHMVALAEALKDTGISSLRFNFPYMQRGGGRTDSVAVCREVFQAAVNLAISESLAHPLLVGGHSFGGRMSTHYIAEQRPPEIRGLLLFSFPLHPSGKPAVGRATHLKDIDVPQLYLSGTRDKLADAALLESVVAPLARATIVWLDTADHGFQILKRTRTTAISVYEEAAQAAQAFVSRLT